MRLLLHTCCGTCFIYPYKILSADFKVSGYYYNPNIHPSSEFLARKEALEVYCSKQKIDLIAEDYDPNQYFSEIDISAVFPARCLKCYELRLRKTAEVAKREGFRFFSTTLLVSPYQEHEGIKKVGEAVADLVGVDFVYYDFREGFNYARELAKSMDLYRQKYCGCIFSEFESFVRRKG